MTALSVCRGAVRRRVAAALVLGLTLASVAACSSDPNSIAGWANADHGDGAIKQLAIPQRGKPLQLSGKTVAGADWSMAKDGFDKVVVVNVWGAWCGPCVVETPHLQKVWSTYESAKEPVTFVGIDINESPATGASFLTANGVTYPGSPRASSVLSPSAPSPPSSTTCSPGRPELDN